MCGRFNLILKVITAKLSLFTFYNLRVFTQPACISLRVLGFSTSCFTEIQVFRCFTFEKKKIKDEAFKIYLNAGIWDIWGVHCSQYKVRNQN